MGDTEGLDKVWGGEPPAADEVQSPEDKLEENPPTGELTPGAQNPDSTEIKKEINPNSE